MRSELRPVESPVDSIESRSFRRVLGALAAAPPVPLEALTASFAAGDVVGDYELLGVLGRGGMSVVYRARDRLLGRDVAIKVLQPVWGRESERDADLEAEARATARLRHPRIVTIHRVGRHAGRLYLVLELLEGETLAARLGRGPLGPSEARRTVLELCDALGHAHDQGIVHRDVKPGNIFLEAGTGAKLFDFGLSGADPATAAQGTGAPTASGWSGTPAYMAPEQWRGEPADPRSDVYAAGVVLHELLTGRLPDRAVARFHRRTTNPRHSIPPDLVDVIAIATSPRREHRYASAAEMAAALADQCRPGVRRIGRGTRDQSVSVAR